MGLGRDARAIRPFLPAPATEPTASLELVAPRRRVRRNRTVTILKIPRLWPALQVGRLSPASPALASTATAPASADGLDAFGSESDPVPTVPKVRVAPPPPPASSRRRPLTMPKWLPSAAKWAAVIVLTAATAIGGVFLYQKRFAPAATTGSVTLDTTPSGLDVVLAGKSLGKTPLTTTLAAGSYDLQVGAAPSARTIKVNVVAGTTVVQHVEFAEAAATAAAATGGLRVQTEPSHLPVFVDGTNHGNVTGSDRSTAAGRTRGFGPHEFRRRSALGHHSTARDDFADRFVDGAAARSGCGQRRLDCGHVASSLAASRRRQADRHQRVGSPDAHRWRSRHRIRQRGARIQRLAAPFTSPPERRQARRSICPNGTLSINAQPWAEVWVDGERVGETPIGNLSRRIGTHEVLFRHPDLGERRETVRSPSESPHGSVSISGRSNPQEEVAPCILNRTFIVTSCSTFLLATLATRSKGRRAGFAAGGEGACTPPRPTRMP